LGRSSDKYAAPRCLTLPLNNAALWGRCRACVHVRVWVGWWWWGWIGCLCAKIPEGKAFGMCSNGTRKVLAAVQYSKQYRGFPSRRVLNLIQYPTHPPTLTHPHPPTHLPTFPAFLAAPRSMGTSGGLKSTAGCTAPRSSSSLYTTLGGVGWGGVGGGRGGVGWGGAKGAWSSDYSHSSDDN
jgi:hypothetical protein